MERVAIIEGVHSWRIFVKDDRGRIQHCAYLGVQICAYDDREKRLMLAKERAAILAYECGLCEYFVCRSGGKPERVVLEAQILLFADRLELKQTDQAEMILKGQLFRFSGWDGLRFTRYAIIADQEASLAHSPLFTRLFSRDSAVFYRLKVASQEVKQSA
jgi:hypothetical protein